MRQTLAGLALSGLLAGGMVAAQSPKKPGIALGDVSWYEAAGALGESAVVVIPLGVAAAQHGPHLKLNHDERLARYLASRVEDSTEAVIAPPFTYHYSPALVDYPGSATLTQTTARNMTMDAVRSLSRYGPRRFYILNTSVGAAAPLAAAATALRDDGILLGHTDAERYLKGTGLALQQAPARPVGHADEVQTSMMLFVDPSAVDMEKAVREYGSGSGPMTRDKDAASGLYSSTGVFGDPTLATREKGRVLVENFVNGILADIGRIRAAPLPQPRPSAPAAPPPSSRPNAPSSSEPRRPNGCTEGDERAIRQFGPRFTYHWSQAEADKIALMFTRFGDMRHPDGYIERGQEVILTNRTDLFKKPEYANSKHNLQLMDIRCLGPETAIADGKWDLRLSDEPARGRAGRALGPGRSHKGLVTLTFLKPPDGGSWAIEAWRYTVDPPDGVPPPTTLKQPGFLGRGGGH
jgi:creatinine amidohydrolase